MTACSNCISRALCYFPAVAELLAFLCAVGALALAFGFGVAWVRRERAVLGRPASDADRGLAAEASIGRLADEISAIRADVARLRSEPGRWTR